ncbi:type II toxin-antitoxin system VapC family toxin [Sorangium sp. So ce1335]|uniref:type II toxin-antitoxin system VapC family toxin n=1 Tax=Sorangium sp. So ce1335 TaxID=3133335 RepID=UPI003F612B7D
MGYLIDTNVASELRKAGAAHPRFIAWSTRVEQSAMFLSVLVVGEIRRGIESLRRKDTVQAQILEAWLARILLAFSGRILPVTQEIAEVWGRLSVPDKLPIVDGLLAATAIVHDLTLVTRNVRDVARSGVKLINPFDEPSSQP